MPQQHEFRRTFFFFFFSLSFAASIRFADEQEDEGGTAGKKKHETRICIICVRLLSITNYTLIFTVETVMTRFGIFGRWHSA